MPKRSTHTYESEKDGISGSDLTVYYCMACGESNLIVGPGVVLTALPKRRTDGAHVLEKGSTVFKLKTVPFETKLLRREKGYALDVPGMAGGEDLLAAFGKDIGPHPVEL